MRRFVLIAIVAIVAAVATAVATAGSGKFELLGPSGNAYCDGGVLAGDPGGFGFAVINLTGEGDVAATVSVKGLDPNTEYHVYLVQGPADRGTVDGTITTNGQGNGTIHVSEPSVSSHAWVGIETGGFSQIYVTDTYNH
jgi:hypothetical protein